MMLSSDACKVSLQIPLTNWYVIWSYIIKMCFSSYSSSLEYHTSEGRIDLILQTDQFVYIMEFKLDGTAEEAIKQINDKHYAQAFNADKRKLYKIGINFSNKTRNIERWIAE